MHLPYYNRDDMIQQEVHDALDANICSEAAIEGHVLQIMPYLELSEIRRAIVVVKDKRNV